MRRRRSQEHEDAAGAGRMRQLATAARASVGARVGRRLFYGFSQLETPDWMYPSIRLL
jgi:hypothetical protein